MKYKMVAIDFDGTLLNPDGIVDDHDAEAVSKLREGGVLVIPCTGRSWTEAAKPLKAIGHIGPCVLVDGAHVFDNEMDKTVYCKCLQTQDMENFIAVVDGGREPILALLEHPATGIDYVVLNDESLPALAKTWFGSLGVSWTAAPSVIPYSVLRIGTLATAERAEQLRSLLMENLGAIDGSRLQVQTFPAGDGLIKTVEFLPPNVNKWHAIDQLAKSMQIEAHEIAAIGDSHNDTKMVKMAGCGVAMGNACSETRRVAKRRTKCNAENGVAFALARMLEGIW